MKLANEALVGAGGFR